MEQKKIEPVKNIINKRITVSVPGSKSITNRALLLATLAEGESRLGGALFSDDSRHFLKCVEDLGFETVVDEPAHEISVTGLGGAVPKKEASIYVGSAGTAARFLAAYLGCSEGRFYLDASAQMRKRPMEPLLRALESVGAEITCTEEPRHFPMEICGQGITRSHITVDIDKSSQFLSALLISGCLTKDDLHIYISGSHGMAYIQMTMKMMEQFGVRVEQVSEREYVIPAGQQYRAMDYYIEPDASAAAYFWAMAAVLGISVTVEHLHFDSLQGDVAFARILEQMGCQVEDKETGITVTGPVDGVLKGIDVNMHACSDQAITLAAIAPFADSPVRITGISHIRLQESDRIAAIVENLTALGVRVEEETDGVVIYPDSGEVCGEVSGSKGENAPDCDAAGDAQKVFGIASDVDGNVNEEVLIQTHDDHRLAMGFAITGLRKPGVTILDPMCCRKTFENYFEVVDGVVYQIQST